jgi:MFS family permease
MMLQSAEAGLRSGPRPTSTPGRVFYGWRIVAVLAVTETVSWGVLYYAFSVFLLPMQAELGFSTATLTGAFSVALLVTGLGAVPVGRWLDAHGPRALMTIGAVLASGLVVAWSQVQSVGGLYAVFVGIGLVRAAVLYEPAFAVVVRWFDAKRSSALLAVTVVAGFASTVFLPLSNALVEAFGWRDALLVLAAVLAVGTILPHWLVLRRAPADLGLLPDGAPAGGQRGSPEPEAANRQSLAETARWALRHRTFRCLALSFAANALAVVVVAVHLVPYLREQGHSPAFAAVATGALGALSVSGRLVLTGAARRLSTSTVTAAMFAVQALAVLVLLAAGRTTTGALCFVALFGLGFGVGTIARPAILAETYGTTRYATLSGLLAVVLTMAMTIGPFAAGLTRTATGSYTPVLLALAALCAVSAVAVRKAVSRQGAAAGR